MFQAFQKYKNYIRKELTNKKNEISSSELYISNKQQTYMELIALKCQRANLLSVFNYYVIIWIVKDICSLPQPCLINNKRVLQ